MQEQKGFQFARGKNEWERNEEGDLLGDTSSDSSKRSDAFARSILGISNKSKRIAKDPLKLKQKANSSSENQDSNLA